MRKVISVIVIAGVQWLVTVGLMLAEYDTSGFLGLFPTRGHGVVAGFLTVLQFPLLWILRARAPGSDSLYLPVMISNSLLWGVGLYYGFRLVRRPEAEPADGGN
jgi:hypothetical protein